MTSCAVAKASNVSRVGYPETYLDKNDLTYSHGIRMREASYCLSESELAPT